MDGQTHGNAVRQYQADTIILVDWLINVAGSERLRAQRVEDPRATFTVTELPAMARMVLQTRQKPPRSIYESMIRAIELHERCQRHYLEVMRQALDKNEGHAYIIVKLKPATLFYVILGPPPGDGRQKGTGQSQAWCLADSFVARGREQSASTR